MKRFFVLLMPLLALTSAGRSQCRPNSLAVTLETLADRDLSLLWIGPIPDGDLDDTAAATTEWDERPDPLGYIGKDFQRFYLHFNRVLRSPDHPLRYELSGYTRVRETICRFKGQLQLDSLQAPASSALCGDGHTGWTLWGHYTLHEAETQPGAGVFEGVHALTFAVGPHGDIRYDATEIYSDSYCNNTWRGVWRSYKTGMEKPCNWGDFRIPDSGALDIGCAEFSPAEEFLSKGWQSYHEALSGNENAGAARAEESRRWWLWH